MAAEITGGNQTGAETPALASSPDAESQPSQPETVQAPAGAAPGTDQGGESHTDTPTRERFDQMNDRMKSAESTNANLQNLVQNLVTANTQLQGQVAQPPAPEQPNNEMDDYRRNFIIRNDDGTVNEESTDDVFNSVLELVEHVAKREAGNAKKEALTEATWAVDNKMQSLGGTLQMKDRIAAMQAQGRLSAGDANKVSSRIATAIQQQPEWAKHQHLLFNNTVFEMQESGEIVMNASGTSPRVSGATMPATPGSTGSNRPTSPGASTVQQTQDADIENMRRRFPRLRRATVEQLRDFYIPDDGTTESVNTPTGVEQVSTSVMRGAFKHTRPEGR